MIFKKINYEKLNHRQKENYNFHKIAALLADYGYNSIRLSDDYQGADFLSIHVEHGDILRIQLKGRLTFAQKYLGKRLFICFRHSKSGDWYLYPHDELWAVLSDQHNAHNTPSWLIDGSYNFPTPSAEIMKLLVPYQVKETEQH